MLAHVEVIISKFVFNLKCLPQREVLPNSPNPGFFKRDAEFGLAPHQLLVPVFVAERVLSVLGVSLASSVAARMLVVYTAAA